jgi:2-polyprenyl-3-methyl-5-hydroxy-6-metoxy-1,4-benzoquinol methylase
MTRNLRSCPVCLGTSIDPVFTNSMAPVGGFDLSYAVGRCTHCGFHFAHDIADEATFKAYYQQVSKYDVAQKISPLEQSRMDAAIALCSRWIPKKHMLIDLGCGCGGFLACLAKAGWSNLHGVDPAPNSGQRAKELFGLHSVHHATMDQAHHKVDIGSADLVSSMMVLEHLPNLRTEMATLLAQLKPGCKILIEVPSVEHFSGVKGEPFGELSLEHIQFFTAVDLQNLFEQLGATTIAMASAPLPIINSGSLFGLFERPAQLASQTRPKVDRSEAFQRYIQTSSQTLDQALQRIPQRQPLIIYGAGSHTARLLPRLETMPDVEIAAVVDNNPNLQSKHIGLWPIQLPGIIADTPTAPVLVSSYQYQQEIATSLRSRYPNPLVLLYT